MDLLLHYADALEEWQRSKRAGLTAATFFATILTLRSVVACCKYLLTEKKFTFVLTGKLQSDPIEGRFGWYRQLNGANFLMSVKQLFEAEKKIRVLNQLTEACKPGDDSNLLQPTTAVNSEERLKDSEWLISNLNGAGDISLDELSATERNVLFFVAGYLGRSVCKQRKCLNCRALLLEQCDIQPSEEEHSFSSDDMRQLFDMADRGGLATPSAYTLSVCSVGYLYFSHINRDKDILRKFLKCKYQQTTFTDVTNLAMSDHAFAYLVAMKCCSDENHLNFEWLVKKLFNCFAKNLLSRLNEGLESDPKNSQKRKISKFQGHSKDCAKKINC